MTYTYVEMDVSQSTYDEVKAKLREADYGHAIGSEGALDMHGLALVLELIIEPQQDPAAPPSIPAAWQDPDCPRHVLSAEDMRDYTNADINSAVTREVAARCTRPLYAAPPSGVQAATLAEAARLNDQAIEDTMEWPRGAMKDAELFDMTYRVRRVADAATIAATKAIFAAAPPVAPAPAREGWQLVPLEPSVPMLRAASEERRDHINTPSMTVQESARRVWAAMLSAAAPAEPPAVEAAHGTNS